MRLNAAVALTFVEDRFVLPTPNLLLVHQHWPYQEAFNKGNKVLEEHVVANEA